MDANADRLVSLLMKARNEVATSPINVIGTNVSVTAKPGGGNVTGIKVEATSRAGSSGTVIGMNSSASSSQADAMVAERGRLLAEINEAIDDLKGGQVRKSALRRLAERFGGAALGAGADVLKDQIEQAIGGLPG